MIKKIGQFIAHSYYWLLYYFGFADTDGELQTPNDREKITFMLRRMKERMGLLWWLLSLGSMYLVWALVFVHHWAWVFLVAFQLWLFVHVLWPYSPPDDIWKGRAS